MYLSPEYPMDWLFSPRGLLPTKSEVANPKANRVLNQKIRIIQRLTLSHSCPAESSQSRRTLLRSRKQGCYWLTELAAILRLWRGGTEAGIFCIGPTSSSSVTKSTGSIFGQWIPVPLFGAGSLSKSTLGGKCGGGTSGLSEELDFQDLFIFGLFLAFWLQGQPIDSRQQSTTPHCSEPLVLRDRLGSRSISEPLWLPSFLTSLF